jgi:hypothetical protein
MALWVLLGLVVFNVTFDWQTRTSGLLFAGAQLQRQRLHQPLPTIEEGFRPMVRQAALASSRWLVLIVVTGGVLVASAGRTRERA